MLGPTETTGLHVLRPLRVWIAALTILWLALVATEIRVRGPYIDEGFYSLSAHSFVTHGDWGAPEVEPSGFVYPNIAQPLTRIDRRAYFYMPLQVFIQTAWVEIVGWGLIQHRVLCTLFGIAGLILWFRTLQLISDSVTAAIATVLIGFDYTYSTDAGFGRMDLMGQTFGIAALSIHERYFVSNPWRARFLSGLMLAAALMVHTYAFAVWACGLPRGQSNRFADRTTRLCGHLQVALKVTVQTGQHIDPVVVKTFQQMRLKKSHEMQRLTATNQKMYFDLSGPPTPIDDRESLVKRQNGLPRLRCLRIADWQSSSE